LQIGLNSDYWWINLYIDKKGWIEQYNLIEKIKDLYFESEFYQLLDSIAEEGYEFYIYPYPYEDSLIFTDGRDFVKTMREFKNSKKSCSISIEKTHKPNDINNNHSILNYLKGEFAKLLPLYNFISWHPKKNHYLIGL